MSIDPAIALLLRLALAVLLALASLHKLSDSSSFAAALAGYRVLPRPLLGALVRLVPAVEMGIALMLSLPAAPRPAALAAALLMGLYAAAIAANLASGQRSVGCGCLGSAGREELSGALVARNLVLAALAAIAALPPADRTYTWIDAVTVAGGVPVLALLYVAADTLMANDPALERLRLRSTLP